MITITGREDSTSCKMMQFLWKRDPETRPRRQKQHHGHADDANCTRRWQKQHCSVVWTPFIRASLIMALMKQAISNLPVQIQCYLFQTETSTSRVPPFSAHQTSAPDPSRPWLDASLRVLRQTGLDELFSHQVEATATRSCAAHCAHFLLYFADVLPT
ncbi:hypothetical protein V8C44DRAFT_340918 [Trichoderma aethiopicum]